MSGELYIISSEVLVSKEDGPSVLCKSEMLFSLEVLVSKEDGPSVLCKSEMLFSLEVLVSKEDGPLVLCKSELLSKSDLLSEFELLYESALLSESELLSEPIIMIYARLLYRKSSIASESKGCRQDTQEYRISSSCRNKKERGNLTGKLHLRLYRRSRLPTLLFLLESLHDVLYGALSLIYLSAIRDVLKQPVMLIFTEVSAQRGIQTLQSMLGLAKWVGERILLTSTLEVYGHPLVHPHDELLGKCQSHWSYYDEEKRVAETLTFDYQRQHGIEIRISINTYGPRMNINDGRVVINFIAQAIQ
ncbi:UDP-glucuronic acid decarboxylase 6-like protein [Tanacetum coccineum]